MHSINLSLTTQITGLNLTAMSLKSDNVMMKQSRKKSCICDASPGRLKKAWLSQMLQWQPIHTSIDSSWTNMEMCLLKNDTNNSEKKVLLWVLNEGWNFALQFLLNYASIAELHKEKIIDFLVKRRKKEYCTSEQFSLSFFFVEKINDLKKKKKSHRWIRLL